MLINLTELNSIAPIEISQEEYLSLVELKTNGWSQCETKIEWLAKLTYLRKGLEQGKISKENFKPLEETLAINWIKKQF